MTGSTPENAENEVDQVLFQQGQQRTRGMGGPVSTGYSSNQRGNFSSPTNEGFSLLINILLVLAQPTVRRGSGGFRPAVFGR